MLGWTKKYLSSDDDVIENYVKEGVEYEWIASHDIQRCCKAEFSPPEKMNLLGKCEHGVIDHKS